MPTQPPTMPRPRRSLEGRGGAAAVERRPGRRANRRRTLRRAGGPTGRRARRPQLRGTGTARPSGRRERCPRRAASLGAREPADATRAVRRRPRRQEAPSSGRLRGSTPREPPGARSGSRSPPSEPATGLPAPARPARLAAGPPATGSERPLRARDERPPHPSRCHRKTRARTGRAIRATSIRAGLRRRPVPSGCAARSSPTRPVWPFSSTRWRGARLDALNRSTSAAAPAPGLRGPPPSPPHPGACRPR